VSSVTRTAAPTERSERIKLSHYRSTRAGLRSADALNIITQDYDEGSRLLTISGPVLQRLASALDDTMAGGLLADRHGTVVDRYFGNAAMRRAADDLGAVIGSSFTEERTGTNGLSVPLETKASTLVYAQEHFLDDLKGFSCYGVPIVNPVTNRLAGVVDLMVADPTAPRLMASLLEQAACDISGRLLSDYDAGIALSVAALRNLNNRTKDPIVLVTGEFFVHNASAAALVSAEDAEALREIAGRLAHSESEQLQLVSGVDITVTTSPTEVDGSVLLRLNRGQTDHPTKRRSTSKTSGITAVDRSIQQLAATPTDSVLVIGDPGTGRSRAARHILGDTDITVIDAALDDPQESRQLVRALSHTGLSDGTAILIEHVEMLQPEPTQAVIDLLRTRPQVRLVVTATPSFSQRPEIEYLASTCSSWLELPSLSQRSKDFDVVVEQLLAEIVDSRHTPAGQRPTVTRATVQHLRSLPWPGNIAELRSVLSAAVDRRSVGDIVVSDLPERYRRASAARSNLTPMELAERDVIVEALSEAGGNKVQTAQHLGISRSKLYDRIRHFKIQTH
jgi:transcriptional regulator of acetoin/glycerol metabolism